MLNAIKKNISKLYWIVGLFFICSVSWADICNPDDADYDPDACSNTIPIDGGVSLLVAAGVALGTKKLMANRKRAAQ